MRPITLFDPADVATPEPPQLGSRRRDDVPDRFKWNLSDIFPDWDSLGGGLQTARGRHRPLRGAERHAGGGPDAAAGGVPALRGARAACVPRLVLPVAPATTRISATTRSTPDASRSRSCSRGVKQAESWFNPELLADSARDRARVDGRESEPLAALPFAIENLYRQQEHVLDEAGERLMSLSSRLASSPNDAYWALSTADAQVPDDHAVDTASRSRSRTANTARCSRRGASSPIARRRSARCTRRIAGDAEHLRLALQRRLPARLVPGARARLQEHARGRAARRQHPDVGRREPDRDDAGRRRAAAPLSPPAPKGARRAVLSGLRLLDSARHLRQEISTTTTCSTGSSTAVAPLGPEYQARMREGFAGRWIDVYENEGKRSGAYSAPVYGTHPYMLLNYTDTLDDVFTLAHEMGHSMHTILSHEAQPFVYSSYTIFVAEVPSTLSEALLLEYMLTRSIGSRSSGSSCCSTRSTTSPARSSRRCCLPTTSCGRTGSRNRISRSRPRS